MKKINIIALPLITSFLVSFAPRPVTQSTEIAIIINAENPSDKMGAEFVRNYWLRRFVKRWKETNKSILPVDRKDKCDEQEIFYNKVLGLPPSAVEAYLAARQYQNNDAPPKKLSTDAEIINYVAHEPGAIGYVNASSVRESDKAIKVILTVSK